MDNTSNKHFAAMANHELFNRRLKPTEFVIAVYASLGYNGAEIPSEWLAPENISEGLGTVSAKTAQRVIPRLLDQGLQDWAARWPRDLESPSYYMSPAEYHSPGMSEFSIEDCVICNNRTGPDVED